MFQFPVPLTNAALLHVVQRLDWARKQVAKPVFCVHTAVFCKQGSTVFSIDLSGEYCLTGCQFESMFLYFSAIFQGSREAIKSPRQELIDK